MLLIALSCLNFNKLLPVCLPYIMTDLSSDPVAIKYFPSATTVITLLCPNMVYTNVPFLLNILAVMSREPVSTFSWSEATDTTSSL